MKSEMEFASPRVLAIASELFGTADAACLVTNPAGGAGILLPTAMIALMPQVIDSLFERDAACAEAKAPVKITRRRIDGWEVYFAINDSDADRDGEIRFCGPSTPRCRRISTLPPSCWCSCTRQAAADFLQARDAI